MHPRTPVLLHRPRILHRDANRGRVAILPTHKQMREVVDFGFDSEISAAGVLTICAALTRQYRRDLWLMQTPRKHS